MTKFAMLLPWLLLASLAQAEGRLFYTQPQRAALEQARLHHVQDGKVSMTKPADRPLTFDGMVIRSDGHDTHWINGRPVADSRNPPAYKGQPLKPGQTVANGRVYEPEDLLRGNLP